MNKILLLLTFLFSTTALAKAYTWDELEMDGKYHVAYDIPINENLTLKADSPLYYKDLIAGGIIPIMVFSFFDPSCVNPDFESDLTLFNPEPEDTVHDKSIGIQYSKECVINIFVEPRLYYEKSIFAD